jgi:hypothetical protein
MAMFNHWSLYFPNVRDSRCELISGLVQPEDLTSVHTTHLRCSVNRIGHVDMAYEKTLFIITIHG